MAIHRRPGSDEVLALPGLDGISVSVGTAETRWCRLLQLPKELRVTRPVLRGKQNLNASLQVELEQMLEHRLAIAAEGGEDAELSHAELEMLGTIGVAKAHFHRFHVGGVALHGDHFHQISSW